MIICSNCGRRIKDDNAAVCPYCKVPTRYSKKTPAKEIKTNGFALAGLILGIAGLFLGIWFCIPPIVGISMSVVGLLNVEKCNSGKKMAKWGLSLSIIGTVIWLAFWIYMLCIVVFS